MKTISGAIDYCTKTDRGLKRSRNEDSYIVIGNIQKRNHSGNGIGALFAVADGMSGHIGGATASEMAIEGLRKHYMNVVKSRETVPVNGKDENLRDLGKVILGIHEEISGLAENVKKYKYMGTTLSVLLLSGNTAYIAHVGDSRIYRLRKDRFEQLTHDDTMAQLSVEMGYMEAEEAITHPLRHSLVQSLGQGVDEVQMVMKDIKSGDVFLLCSDGLYDMVSDSEIRDILRDGADGWRPCDHLVAAALRNGGKDNVTVIVVRIL